MSGPRLVVDTAETVQTNLRKITNTLDIDISDRTDTVLADDQSVSERKTEKP